MSSLLARRWLPEAALLFVVVIWSTTWIAMKDALKQIDPLAFMSARFVCIALLAWSLLHIRLHGDRSASRIDRADWARLTAGGLIGYSAYQLCSVFALDRSSVFTPFTVEWRSSTPRTSTRTSRPIGSNVDVVA